MQKQIPKTDDKREASLTTAKNRKDGALPADNPFSVANSAALDMHEPLFRAKRNNVSKAEEASHDLVKLLEAAFIRGTNIASHSLQIVNFMIINGKPSWTISSRTFYGLPLGGKLPPMTSHREIIQALTNFIKGETDHIADGGIALKDITKADAEAVLAEINALLQLLADSKEAIVEANKELAAERTEVDALIPLLWSDIEHKAQALTTGARHEYGILWGMQFKNTKGIGIANISVEDEDTHEKLAGIDVRLGSINGKEGTKIVTNLHGEGILESHNLKDTFIVATNISYVTSARPTKLIAGEELTIVIKLKKKDLES